MYMCVLITVGLDHISLNHSRSKKENKSRSHFAHSQMFETTRITSIIYLAQHSCQIDASYS